MRLFRRKKVLVCSSCAAVHDEADYKKAVAELFFNTFMFEDAHIYYGLKEAYFRGDLSQDDLKILEKQFSIYKARKVLNEARSDT